MYNYYNATSEGDTTHLNPRGETLFGRMVNDLLNEKYADLFGEYTVENATLSGLLQEGFPA